MIQPQTDEADIGGATGGSAWLLLWCPSGPDSLDLALTVSLQRLGLARSAVGRASGSIVDFAGAAIALAVEPDLASSTAQDVFADTTRACGVAPPYPGSGSTIRLSASHAAGDRATIAQKLCTLAALIADETAATALYWPPARLWSATEHLASAVAATEASDLPPVLHLVAFDHELLADGGRRLTSFGLAWFAGHEMALTCASPISESEALRRSTRLAIDALLHGGLVGPMIVAGIEKGETLVIGALTAGNPAPVVDVTLRMTP
jgi:hypothetical protein